MNTETTENKPPVKGWLFYDGECPMCRGGADCFYDVLLRCGLHPVPLQAAWVKSKLGLTEAKLMEEMQLLMANGRVFRGADAFLQITRAIWWSGPFYALGRLPGVMPVVRVIYSWIARNRHCVSGVCKLTQPGETHPVCKHGASSFYELP